MKGGLVVAGEDRNRLLSDDRAAVERGIDDMDRYARDRDAVRKGIPDRVRAREGRQERRMGVEDPPSYAPPSTAGPRIRM